MQAKKSIGVFDSGLGGLTVLRVLAQKFPNENFCYLGDVARLPYGNKSPETIHLFVKENLDFLLKQNVKALIIACNSASTVFLDENEYEGIPLLNVIIPGALAASKHPHDGRIAVLGTAATVKAHAYLKVLKRINPKVDVIEKACPLFVSLVEEGFIEENFSQLIIKKYLKDIKDRKIKTVILGCTHYPILKKPISDFLGKDVSLIESGYVLADELLNLFDQNILTKENKREGHDSQVRVFTTDLTEHFERLATRLLEGVPVAGFEKVTL